MTYEKHWHLDQDEKIHTAVSESREAKGSMFGETPNLEIAAAKMGLLSVHSVLVLKTLDCRSASIFSAPGMWTAVNQTLCSIHQSQISLTS